MYMYKNPIFGKESKNSLQMNALSYALKLGKNLNYKTTSILSNGCYVKHNKLQKKSTIPLCR